MPWCSWGRGASVPAGHRTGVGVAVPRLPGSTGGATPRVPRGGSAVCREPLDPGEVHGHRLTGAVAVQCGGIHVQPAGQRRVAAVRTVLQTCQQQRELRYVVVDCIHVVRTRIHPSACAVPSCPDPGRHSRHSPYLHVNKAGMVAGWRRPSPRDHPHPRRRGRRLPRRRRPGPHTASDHRFPPVSCAAWRSGSGTVGDGRGWSVGDGPGRRRTRLGSGLLDPCCPIASALRGHHRCAGSGAGPFAPSSAKAAGAGRVPQVSGRRPQWVPIPDRHPRLPCLRRLSGVGSSHCCRSGAAVVPAPCGI